MAVTALDLLFRQAVELHQRGELSRALSTYEALLLQQPAHTRALQLAAIVALRLGDTSQGLALAERSVRLDGNDAIAHFNRGVALRTLRRLPLAASSFERVIQLQPQFAAAHLQHALTLLDLGRLEAALAAVDRALGLLPDSAEALLCRGVILERRAQLDAALGCYERILQLDTRHVDALFNRGNVLRDLGRAEEALQSYDSALAVRPHHAATLTNRGTVLAMLDEIEAALASFDQALGIDPTDAAALNGRGAVLEQLGRREEALESLQRALAHDPLLLDAHNNRAVTLQGLGRLDEALVAFEQARSIDPQHARTRLNHALALLSVGDYQRGWREYEWRWRMPDAPRARALPPRWRGEEPLAGRSILLTGEQGFGDSLQFCRYAPRLAALGAHVVLQVPAALVTLLQSLQGVGEVIADEQAPPACDYHCPLLSLPLALKTTLQSIPSAVPYLRAESQRVADWATRLGPSSRPRVGVVWSGGLRAGQPWQRRRNIPLTLLAPLGRIDTVEFFSLQKGEPAESELAALTAGGWHGPRLMQHSAQLRDFADTAALVEQLDLVISVDTALVHLAGALGKPIWILNRFDSCWRWFRERTDSPWYPSARLYRQARAGEWTAVIEHVVQDLHDWASQPVRLVAEGSQP